MTALQAPNPFIPLGVRAWVIFTNALMISFSELSRHSRCEVFYSSEREIRTQHSAFTPAIWRAPVSVNAPRHKSQQESRVVSYRVLTNRAADCLPVYTRHLFYGIENLLRLSPLCIYLFFILTLDFSTLSLSRGHLANEFSRAQTCFLLFRLFIKSKLFARALVQVIWLGAAASSCCGLSCAARRAI